MVGLMVVSVDEEEEKEEKREKGVVEKKILV